MLAVVRLTALAAIGRTGISSRSSAGPPASRHLAAVSPAPWRCPN